MNEPMWLQTARGYIGQSEVPGPGSNGWIKKMWHSLKAGAWYWTHYGGDDSRLPWCGAFVAHVLNECNIPYPKKYAGAREWLDWGTALTQPVLGCVVIFERRGGGHVGLVVGRDRVDNLLVLGGNQNDRVSIAPFSPDRVLGYRWPLLDLAGLQDALPTLSASLPLSTNEA